MKTILITGCAGLLGSTFAKIMLNKGYKVVGIDNLIGGYRFNLPIHKNFIHFNCSIDARDIIFNIFKKHRPEYVFHFAALAHEGLSVFTPSTITNNIYSGTICIATAAIAYGTSLFINTSSMARYGEITPPFSEDAVCNPKDPYGLAKLQAEQQLNLLSDIHGLKVVHLVPHNVAGPGQCYSDPFRNVLSIFANRRIQQKPVYIYGDGEQKRSFSHIDDCMSAILSVIDKFDYISTKEVFNIGPDSGTEITINRLNELVSSYFDDSAGTIYTSARPQEVKDAWLDVSKAKSVLGYKATKSTEQVVLDTVSWIKESPRLPFEYHLPLEIVNDKTPITWKDKLFLK